MFGLIATTSPFEMNRFMPPRASTARRTSSARVRGAVRDGEHGRAGRSSGTHGETADLALAAGGRQIESAVIEPESRSRSRRAENSAGFGNSSEGLAPRDRIAHGGSLREKTTAVKNDELNVRAGWPPQGALDRIGANSRGSRLVKSAAWD